MSVEFDDDDPFEGITEEMEAKILAELHRSAEDMASIARAMAPRDTGALSESLKVERVPDQLAVRVIAASGETFYGRFIEEGTKKMDENPFFEPARDAVADAFHERMNDIAEGRA